MNKMGCTQWFGEFQPFSTWQKIKNKFRVEIFSISLDLNGYPFTSASVTFEQADEELWQNQKIIVVWQTREKI